MRFLNLSGKRELEIAANEATRLLHPSSSMMRELIQKNDWKYNSGPGSDVVAKLAAPRPAIEVFTYRPVNPWTSALGYFDGRRIHVNIRKLPTLSAIDLIGLMLHEWSHYCGLSHGNNFKTQEKCLYSVPYFASENVERWL